MRALAAVLCAGLLWAGWLELRAGLDRPRPIETTLGLVAGSGAPPAGWVRVRGGSLSLLDALVVERDGRVVELLVPVRPAAARATPARLLLATRDPRLVALVERLRSIADPDELVRFVLDHRGDLFAERDVEGVVRRGPEPALRRRLAELDGSVARDALVLDEAAVPRPLLGWLLWAGAGLVALALVGSLGEAPPRASLVRRRRAATGSGRPKALAAVPPTGTALPARARARPS